MIISIAILIRILSNSMSNVYQKQLTAFGMQPFFINFLSYLGLSIICIPLALNTKIIFSVAVILPAILGGLCGAFGNYYLIKALKYGELSVLGPINAYKSVVAMLIGILLLKEIPSVIGILAVILILLGSYFIFDSTKCGFSLKLLKQKSIQYRIFALVLTATEAIFIKNVINLSDIYTAFYYWCGFGTFFSLLNCIIHNEKLPQFSSTICNKLLTLIAFIGLMQYTTNFVFLKMNVSYALALFQLSAIVSVIFGWKYFAEQNIKKKLIGTTIMIIGACLLILLK